MHTVWLQNSLSQWLIAAGTAGVVLTGLWIAKTALHRRLAISAPRTRLVWDDLLAAALRQTKLFFVVILALFLGSRTLQLPPQATDLFEKIFILALIIQVSIWGAAIITVYVGCLVKASADDGGRAMTVKAMGFAGKLVFFTLTLIWGLDNLGVNITTLIAGLGVGGIAVALALQSVLGDLFASLSIVMDKPFVIGDFIVVGDENGTIENIGLKTTRVRALTGEQLIFPNNNLLQSRIHNYKRMAERRVEFQFHVAYGTPLEKLKKISQITREVITAAGNTRLDRVNLKTLGESSLDFEAAYIVLSADYNQFMDIQERVNFGLLERLKADNIAFALPTRKLFIEGTENLEAILAKRASDSTSRLGPLPKVTA